MHGKEQARYFIWTGHWVVSCIANTIGLWNINKVCTIERGCRRGIPAHIQFQLNWLLCDNKSMYLLLDRLVNKTQITHDLCEYKILNCNRNRLVHIAHAVFVRQNSRPFPIRNVCMSVCTVKRTRLLCLHAYTRASIGHQQLKWCNYVNFSIWLNDWLQLASMTSTVLQFKIKCTFNCEMLATTEQTANECVN